MIHLTHIENSERLTSIFGYWPSFHDAEILSINLERTEKDEEEIGPSLTAKIHLFEMTDKVEAEGHFELTKHTLATLRFGGLVLEWLVNFNGQNVLSELEITAIADDPLDEDTRSCYFDEYSHDLKFKVRFDSSYGCSASFGCREITVVEVAPYEPLV